MTNNQHSLGDEIGRYKLIGEVARGGMGIVYIAAAHGPAGFSKLVALKELRPDLVEDHEFLTMFLEEARMAARLNHPNIVQTNDVSEWNGRHFIAMEYLEGRSFYHVLRRFAPRGGFPQRMALATLRDVLSALDYAHELCGFDGKSLGFVHRDISPHNIFLTFEGHTKVIDFGIAKARDSSLETKTGVLKGRANYMAPEQLMRAADRRSDIFSVGAILFEILSGRRLWQGMSEVEILAALTRGEIPSLSSVRTDTAPALVRICERALAARADDRFNTAAEMRDALDQHLWSTGGAPRVRDISEALMQEFAVEREETRTLIEAALQRLQAGQSGQLEVLAVPEPREGTISSRRGSGSNASVRRSSLGRVPSEVSMRRELSRSGARSIVAHDMSMMPPPPLLAPLEPAAPDLTRRRKLLLASSLGIVFVATTLAVGMHRSAPPPQAEEPVVAVPTSAPPRPLQAAPRELPAPAAAAPVLAPPATNDSVMLSVSVTPANAEVVIDGQTMPSNPFMARFPRGPQSHRIRAVAPGFIPKERLVTYEDNVMIDLSLNPKPVVHEPAPPLRHEPPARRAAAPVLRAAPPPTAPAPPPAAPVVAAPVAASPPPDIISREIAPRRRNIDTRNPYGDEK